jgi:hypothetical protein
MKALLQRSPIACALATFALSTASHSVTCDHSGFGSSLSVAPSAAGHILVVRGTDQLLRFNEWRNSSQTWSGWSILDSTDAHKNSAAPWIQYIANKYGTPAEKGQNIFYSSATEFPQWILTTDGASPTKNIVATKTPTNLSQAGQTIIGRPTSFQTTLDGEQRLIANVNGELKSRTWTGKWDDSWTPLGLTGITGSPYVVQVTPNTGALYVKKGSYLYYSFWDGQKWGTWYNYLANAPLPGDVSGAYFSRHFVFGSTATKVPVYRYLASNAWTSTWKTIPNFPGYQSLSPVSVTSDSALVYGMTATGEIWRIGIKGTLFGTPERFNCLSTQSK